MTEFILQNLPSIVIVLAVAALFFLIGRASRKKYEETCVSTELQIRDTAMKQIEALFYRTDLSDEKFGEACDKIRSTLRPVAEMLKAQKK